MADKSGERATNGVSTGDMNAWKQLYEDLQRIDRPEGSTTTTEFAELMGVSPCRAREILKEMLRKGLATRITYTPRSGGRAHYYMVAHR